MTPLAKNLGQWAVIGLAMISSVQALPSESRAAKAKVPLHLMPLGASITFGYKSTDGNGYREDLRDLLVEYGFSTKMVGSNKGGTMDNNENEGWSGFRVDQVRGKAEKSVPKLQPNLITINAGTNDCAQDFQLDKYGERMEGLIEYLWDTSENSTVILSTLLINLNSTVEARVKKVNTAIRNLVKEKAAEGKRIILAEMHGTDGPQKIDMADNTHPNNEGYNKMAKIWFRCIKQAESKGFLDEPNTK